VDAALARPDTPSVGVAPALSGRPLVHAEPDDTPALTRAASRGDAEAFARIYQRWFARAVGAARELTGRDEAFCLDVAQDAMVRAARRVPPLPDEAALGAWLCRTVHRTALDRLRAERRRRAREARHPAGAGGGPEGTHDRAALDERIARLRCQLDELEALDRTLLGARFARGRTLAQAGLEAGLSGDAAHGRIRRALKQLKRRDPEP
jgi:RNA polymerase sigma factor (sigma-70 family)